MLIRDYNKFTDLIPNHEDLLPYRGWKKTINKYIEYRGLKMPTGDMTLFSRLTIPAIRDLFDEQYIACSDELNLLKGVYNTMTRDETIFQYSDLYFYEGVAYLKQEVLDYMEGLAKSQGIIGGFDPTAEFAPVIEVSRDAIRDITGFTFTPRTSWGEVVTLTWQQKLFEAIESNKYKYIVVDGSRQMGKSKGVSELIIEETWLPNNDTLVASFLQDTTEVIKNYMKSSIEKFDNSTYLIAEKKRYIQNNVTGTRVHFRTLQDEAKNILGLTIHKIVIDEAQEVDVDTMENAVLPTATTTGATVILIGTPSEKVDSFMYKKMMEIKRGEEKNGFLLQVSLYENPLVHPDKRTEIIAKRGTPSIERQYFNAWGGGGDKLFSPKVVSTLPDITESVLVYGIDPARKQDRSGWCILACHKGKIVGFMSWEIPPTFKESWELQAEFHKMNIKKLKQTVVTVMDVTGVGDAVASIFASANLKIDYSIRYNASASAATFDGNYGSIGKQVLINTMLDAIQEDLFSVFGPLNSDLIDEMNYIIRKEWRLGKIEMSSRFYDDITNACMIAVYIACKKQLYVESVAEIIVNKHKNILPDVSAYEKNDNIW